VKGNGVSRYRGVWFGRQLAAFWALSDELSSYEEDDMEDEASSGLLSTGEFLHDALSMCYTIDAFLMAVAQLVAVEVPSPEVRSVSSFAGEKNAEVPSPEVRSGSIRTGGSLVGW